MGNVVEEGESPSNVCSVERRGGRGGGRSCRRGGEHERTVDERRRLHSPSRTGSREGARSGSGGFSLSAPPRRGRTSPWTRRATRGRGGGRASPRRGRWRWRTRCAAWAPAFAGEAARCRRRRCCCRACGGGGGGGDGEEGGDGGGGRGSAVAARGASSLLAGWLRRGFQLGSRHRPACGQGRRRRAGRRRRGVVAPRRRPP